MRLNSGTCRPLRSTAAIMSVSAAGLHLVGLLRVLGALQLGRSLLLNRLDGEISIGKLLDLLVLDRTRGRVGVAAGAARVAPGALLHRSWAHPPASAAARSVPRSLPARPRQPSPDPAGSVAATAVPARTQQERPGSRQPARRAVDFSKSWRFPRVRERYVPRGNPATAAEVPRGKFFVAVCRRLRDRVWLRRPQRSRESCTRSCNAAARIYVIRTFPGSGAQRIPAC